MKISEVAREQIQSILPLNRRLDPKASGISFRDLLRQSTSVPLTASTKSSQSKQLHTVRSQETLWQICQANLSKSGEDASGKAVYDAVTRVAQTNHIANPDLITVGQKIDLSSIEAVLPQAPAPIPPIPVALPAPDLLPGVSSPPPTEKVAEVLTPQAPLQFRDAMLSDKSSAPSEMPAVDKADLGDLLYSILTPTAPNVKSSDETDAPDAGASGLAPVPGPWAHLLSSAARLTSEFGMRKDPFTGAWRYHSGIDLAADKGAQIFPIKSGTVEFSGWQPGYGKVVIVRHPDGTETVYGHNAKNLSKVGQKVTATTPIGLVGSTGRSTGAHLHFEIRKGGAAVDPIPLIKAQSLQVAKTL